MNSNGNFKMKCINDNSSDYTEGKIYEVTNGKWFTDVGKVMGEHDDIKTIDDVNEISGAEWELVKENSIKERMEIIAKMFDLELNEKFNIILNSGKLSKYNPYQFTINGLIDKCGDGMNDYILELLTGNITVEKLPWKPKHCEIVYGVCNGYVYADKFKSNRPDYLALYKLGWLFRTEEEAEANKDRVMKEMNEVIGDE